jgi:hypothetical protein
MGEIMLKDLSTVGILNDKPCSFDGAPSFEWSLQKHFKDVNREDQRQMLRQWLPSIQEIFGETSLAPSFEWSISYTAGKGGGAACLA